MLFAGTVAFGVALLGPRHAHAQCAPGAVCEEVFAYRNGRDRAAFDVQLFEPSSSPRAVFGVDQAAVPSHLTLTAGLWTNYANAPFVLQLGSDASGRRPIVSHLLQNEVHLSLGLFEYFEVGLAMPLSVTSHRAFESSGGGSLSCAESPPAVTRDELERNPGLTPTSFDFSENASMCTGFSTGDLRGFVKVPILRGSWSLAARLGASLPTTLRPMFAGNISWTVTPAVLLSRTLGPATLSLNVGYRLRQRNGLLYQGSNFILDDEVLWGLGARVDVHRAVALDAEISGRIGVSGGQFNGSRVPVELDVGAVFSPSDRVSIVVGVGRGISGGYGSPTVRGFAALRIAATRSQCASGPEDYDGFEDGDFCADPDNDRDQIPDAVDRCPNDAEDRDGVLDDDGCPELDNDADGVLDDNDRCPIEPEDQDGFQDTDGCPEGDNDRDGISDVQDECPREPEDLDNFQDSDGCPEPGPEAVAVTRTDSHLLLSQRVFFDYDSDTIRPVSFPILNELALALRRNPDILRIRVEGYSDGQGDPQYNLDLSYRRARAVVEYLVVQGVARDHLDFRGYGPQRPVADDSTPEGQALNRRVEFTITDQTGSSGGNAGGNASGGRGPSDGGAREANPSRRGGGRSRRHRDHP